MSPPPRPFPSRARSTSHATAVRSLKRLSLSFPAQLEPEQGQKTHTISSSSSSTFLLPSTPSSYSERIAVPTDSNNFLTALATQERRVLEMKEELQKAEIDLDKLKKQWALHEGTRKRDEIRNIGRLEPLKGAFDRSALFESHTDVARKGKELERRKAMYAGTRQPQRKVFSGSRHTRALSLLTPNTCTYERPSRAEKALQPDEISSIDPKLGRSSTVPASMGSTAASANGSARASTSRGVGPPKDAILQTGKQIVGDFKEGLLTFIEDLRQATVGDEAVHGAVHRPEDRAPRSSTNRKTARKSTAQTDLRLRNIALPKPPNVAVDVPRAHPKDRRDGGESSLMELNRGYWELNGAKFMPSATCGSNQRDENKDDTSVDDEDGWEDWDSPTARSISPYRWRDRTHASGEINSSSTVSSSPRTSMRCVAFRQSWDFND
ncbi:Domain of unknown function DUF4048 [Lasallia pustulata]|uniref:DUF4048 domain-containing protein n=1 Tax=Lasallia pustulata TaxID=136370 RepID=A0A1W5CW12_9LECA|nr:Domain of unknown function DUF4048 [Lasallia pustulata]